jgi:E3 SUMO-protein ligase PIAS1
MPASPPVIQEAVNANDPVRLQQIRQSVHNSISSSQTGSSPSRSNFPISHGHASSTPFGLHSMSFPSTHSSLSNGQRSVVNFSSSVTLTFKPSPFYQIEAVAGDIKTCDGMFCASFCVPCPTCYTNTPVKSCRSTVTR